MLKDSLTTLIYIENQKKKKVKGVIHDNHMFEIKKGNIYIFFEQYTIAYH